MNKRSAPPISLSHDDAAVLSFVARHAHSIKARSSLELVLSTSSDIAKAIGSAIIHPDADTESKYRIMADRFIGAAAKNRLMNKYIHARFTG